MNSQWSICFYVLVVILQSTVMVEGSTFPRLLTRTAGCGQSQQPQHTSSGFNIGNYSHEHINRTLKHSVLAEIRDLLAILRQANDAWSETDGYMPVPNRGLRELNPTIYNITQFTNVPPVMSRRNRRYQHVILREIRWLLTAIDTAFQLIHHAGLLGPNQGSIMVTYMTDLSDAFDSILRIFGVPFNDLPNEANCRETFTLTVNSVSDRIRFTSMVLRDANNALTRIYDVLSSCRPSGQHGTRHGLYLDCSHQSTFYNNLPFGNDNGNEIIYTLNYWVNL